MDLHRLRVVGFDTSSISKKEGENKFIEELDEYEKQFENTSEEQTNESGNDNKQCLNDNISPAGQSKKFLCDKIRPLETLKEYIGDTSSPQGSSINCRNDKKTRAEISQIYLGNKTSPPWTSERCQHHIKTPPQTTERTQHQITRPGTTRKLRFTKSLTNSGKFSILPSKKSRKRDLKMKTSDVDLTKLFQKSTYSHQKKRPFNLLKRNSRIQQKVEKIKEKKEKDEEVLYLFARETPNSIRSCRKRAVNERIRSKKKRDSKLPNDICGFQKNKRSMDPYLYKMSCLNFLDTDKFLFKKFKGFHRKLKPPPPPPPPVTNCFCKYHGMRVLNYACEQGESPSIYYNIDTNSHLKRGDEENGLKKVSNMSKDETVQVSPTSLSSVSVSFRDMGTSPSKVELNARDNSSPPNMLKCKGCMSPEFQKPSPHTDTPKPFAPLGNSQNKPTPSAGGATPQKNIPTPSAGGATPAQKIPTPSAGGATLALKIPTPSAGSATPAQKIPTPSAGGATLALKIPTPSAGSATPTQKIPTPSAGRATPAQKIPTPSAGSATSAQKIPTPSAEGATPAQSIPNPSTAFPTPAQNIPHEVALRSCLKKQKKTNKIFFVVNNPPRGLISRLFHHITDFHITKKCPGKNCVKYFLFGLLVVVWSPCLLAVILAWIVMCPARIRNIIKTDTTSKSSLTPMNHSFMHRLRKKDVPSEYQRMCFENYTPKKKRSFMTSVANWYSRTFGNSLKAVISLFKLKKKSSTCCAVSSSLPTTHPNPRKRYTLFYADNRGWVIKPSRRRNTRSRTSSRVVQNIRCEYKSKLWPAKTKREKISQKKSLKKIPCPVHGVNRSYPRHHLSPAGDAYPYENPWPGCTCWNNYAQGSSVCNLVKSRHRPHQQVNIPSTSFYSTPGIAPDSGHETVERNLIRFNSNKIADNMEQKTFVKDHINQRKNGTLPFGVVYNYPCGPKNPLLTNLNIYRSQNCKHKFDLVGKTMSSKCIPGLLLEGLQTQFPSKHQAGNVGNKLLCVHRYPGLTDITKSLPPKLPPKSTPSCKLNGLRGQPPKRKIAINCLNGKTHKSAIMNNKLNTLQKNLCGRNNYGLADLSTSKLTKQSTTRTYKINNAHKTQNTCKHIAYQKVNNKPSKTKKGKSDITALKYTFEAKKRLYKHGWKHNLNNNPVATQATPKTVNIMTNTNRDEASNFPSKKKHKQCTQIYKYKHDTTQRRSTTVDNSYLYKQSKQVYKHTPDRIAVASQKRSSAVDNTTNTNCDIASNCACREEYEQSKQQYKAKPDEIPVTTQNRLTKANIMTNTNRDEASNCAGRAKYKHIKQGDQYKSDQIAAASQKRSSAVDNTTNTNRYIASNCASREEHEQSKQQYKNKPDQIPVATQNRSSKANIMTSTSRDTASSCACREEHEKSRQQCKNKPHQISVATQNRPSKANIMTSSSLDTASSCACREEYEKSKQQYENKPDQIPVATQKRPSKTNIMTSTSRDTASNCTCREEYEKSKQQYKNKPNQIPVATQNRPGKANIMTNTSRDKASSSACREEYEKSKQHYENKPEQVPVATQNQPSKAKIMTSTSRDTASSCAWREQYEKSKQQYENKPDQVSVATQNRPCKANIMTSTSCDIASKCTCGEEHKKSKQQYCKYKPDQASVATQNRPSNANIMTNTSRDTALNWAYREEYEKSKQQYKYKPDQTPVATQAKPRKADIMTNTNRDIALNFPSDEKHERSKQEYQYKPDRIPVATQNQPCNANITTSTNDDIALNCPCAEINTQTEQEHKYKPGQIHVATKKKTSTANIMASTNRDIALNCPCAEIQDQSKQEYKNKPDENPVAPCSKNSSRIPNQSHGSCTCLFLSCTQKKRSPAAITTSANRDIACTDIYKQSKQHQNLVSTQNQTRTTDMTSSGEKHEQSKQGFKYKTDKTSLTTQKRSNLADDTTSMEQISAFNYHGGVGTSTTNKDLLFFPSKAEGDTICLKKTGLPECLPKKQDIFIQKQSSMIEASVNCGSEYEISKIKEMVCRKQTVYVTENNPTKPLGQDALLVGKALEMSLSLAQPLTIRQYQTEVLKIHSPKARPNSPLLKIAPVSHCDVISSQNKPNNEMKQIATDTTNIHSHKITSAKQPQTQRPTPAHLRTLRQRSQSFGVASVYTCGTNQPTVTERNLNNKATGSKFYGTEGSPHSSKRNSAKTDNTRSIFPQSPKQNKSDNEANQIATDCKNTTATDIKILKEPSSQHLNLTQARLHTLQEQSQPFGIAPSKIPQAIGPLLIQLPVSRSGFSPEQNKLDNQTTQIEPKGKNIHSHKTSLQKEPPYQWANLTQAQSHALQKQLKTLNRVKNQSIVTEKSLSNKVTGSKSYKAATMHLPTKGDNITLPKSSYRNQRLLNPSVSQATGDTTLETNGQNKFPQHLSSAQPDKLKVETLYRRSQLKRSERTVDKRFNAISQQPKAKQAIPIISGKRRCDVLQLKTEQSSNNKLEQITGLQKFPSVGTRSSDKTRSHFPKSPEHQFKPSLGKILQDPVDKKKSQGYSKSVFWGKCKTLLKFFSRDKTLQHERLCFCLKTTESNKPVPQNTIRQSSIQSFAETDYSRFVYKSSLLRSSSRISQYSSKVNSLVKSLSSKLFSRKTSQQTKILENPTKKPPSVVFSSFREFTAGSKKVDESQTRHLRHGQPSLRSTLSGRLSHTSCHCMVHETKKKSLHTPKSMLDEKLNRSRSRHRQISKTNQNLSLPIHSSHNMTNNRCSCQIHKRPRLCTSGRRNTFSFPKHPTSILLLSTVSILDQKSKTSQDSSIEISEIPIECKWDKTFLTQKDEISYQTFKKPFKRKSRTKLQHHLRQPNRRSQFSASLNRSQEIVYHNVLTNNQRPSEKHDSRVLSEKQTVLTQCLSPNNYQPTPTENQTKPSQYQGMCKCAAKHFGKTTIINDLQSIYKSTLENKQEKTSTLRIHTAFISPSKTGDVPEKYYKLPPPIPQSYFFSSQLNKDSCKTRVATEAPAEHGNERKVLKSLYKNAENQCPEKSCYPSEEFQKLHLILRARSAKKKRLTRANISNNAHTMGHVKKIHGTKHFIVQRLRTLNSPRIQICQQNQPNPLIQLNPQIQPDQQNLQIDTIDKPPPELLQQYSTGQGRKGRTEGGVQVQQPYPDFDCVSMRYPGHNSPCRQTKKTALLDRPERIHPLTTINYKPAPGTTPPQNYTDGPCRIYPANACAMRSPYDECALRRAYSRRPLLCVPPKQQIPKAISIKKECKKSTMLQNETLKMTSLTNSTSFRESIRQIEKEAWPNDVSCRPLYIHILKKKPSFWIYKKWPSLYPSFLNFYKLMRCLGHFLIYFLTLCFWSPCLLCGYLCYDLLCL